MLYTKFPICAHRLEKEKGRYSESRMEGRLRNLCNKKIEDETHFILQCPFLEPGRSEIIQNINKMNANFINLSPVQKLMWLMSSADIKRI